MYNTCSTLNGKISLKFPIKKLYFRFWEERWIYWFYNDFFLFNFYFCFQCFHHHHMRKWKYYYIFNFLVVFDSILYLFGTLLESTGRKWDSFQHLKKKNTHHQFLIKSILLFCNLKACTYIYLQFSQNFNTIIYKIF